MTQLTVRNLEDLIALAPVTLGFHPVESVVMLTFGARHPFHARIDLPPPGQAGVLDTELVAVAEAHAATAIALLIFTEDAAGAEAAWRALRRSTRTRRLAVVAALHVRADTYVPLGGPGVRRVVPYDVGDHPFLAQAVFDGHITHRSRENLARTVQPEPERVAALARRLEALPAWPGDAPPEGVLAEGAFVERLVARCLREGGVPDDAELARMLHGMRLVRVRDAAWSQIRRTEARAAVDLFAAVLRRAPDPWLAAPAALTAWAAWQAGDGALAWCALDRCRGVDPGYVLADLVARMLEAAVPPVLAAEIEGFDWAEGLRAG